jgi:hypothetical protein
MLKRHFALSAFVFVLAAAAGQGQPAYAGDCVLHVKRIACAGQEAETYKKCNGQQECDEDDAAATAEACASAALASCGIKRPGVVSAKIMSAKFKGSALKGGFSADGKADAEGPNFCAADRPDYNQCK